MEVIGLVAEWNPLHNGHAFLIEQIRLRHPEATIVAAMSGSFCQRGLVSFFDKWQRTEMALAQGIDLVLELPQLGATASLEFFAKAGVHLIKDGFPVSHFFCGSESGDQASIEAQAHYLEAQSATLLPFIHQAIRQGIPYGNAVQAFLEEAKLTDNLRFSPNDRLALHYRLALGPSIPLHLIKRQPTAQQPTIASASQIRALFEQDTNKALSFMPSSSIAIVKKAQQNGWSPPNMNKLLSPLKALMCSLTPSDLSEQLHIRDGWEHRFHQAILSATSFESLIDQAQTRIYSRSRIQRLLLQCLSPIKHSTSAITPAPYFRVLGGSMRGRHLLKSLSHQGLPLILNVAKGQRQLSSEARAILQYDINRQNLADFIYGLPITNRDYLEPPRFM